MIRLKKILQCNYIYVLFLVFILLYAYLISNYHISDYKYNGNVKGTLISKKIDGNKVSMTLKDKVKINAIYYMNDEKELDYFNNLDLGIILKIYGEEKEVINNTIPNTFNYKEYLKYHNIVSLIDVEKYEVINNNPNIFYKLKNGLRDYISTFKSKDYLETFIIGKKEYLDDEVYSKYQDLGVSHIFAISGMHISILTSLILRLLKRLKDNTKYLIIITFLLFYMFVTNYTASVSRSVMLFITLYMSKRLDLNISNINCYILSIGFLLLINPYFLYDIGFLYSSIVSFSLIKYTSIIKGNYFISILKVSLIAFLFSLPITINNNYEINILSVINNLFFAPVISFIIYPLSLLTLILKPLDDIFFLLTRNLEYISNYLFVFKIIIPKMSIMFIMIYYVLLWLFMKTYQKKILLILLIMFIFSKYSYLFDNNYYVYYLDVHQGDSTLIKYRDETILIDTGGKISYKEDEWKKKKKTYISDNTIRFMKSIGIADIDYLIITHGDTDHGGDALHLLENFKVKNLILNKGEYNNIEKELLKYNINNTNIYTGKIDLKLLDTSKIYDNENDNSIITYLNLNGNRFLFMGDASIKVEKDMLSKYDLIDIDFFKVGHHGSNTSSSKEFIDAINPKYSIISVGKNNRYGHPKGSVLSLLANSKIYRTDEDGSIEVIINKNGYKIKTCLP